MSTQISLIVRTGGLQASLIGLLDGLARQSLAPTSYELLLVAEEQVSNLKSWLQGLALPYSWRVVEEAAKGPVAALNAAAEAALYPTLLFLDERLEPGSRLVEAHLKAQAEAGPGESVVLGYFSPSPAGNTTDSLALLDDLSQTDRLLALARPAHRLTFQDLASPDFSLPVSLFKRIGGFDPRFAGPRGPEIELGVRLLEAGTLFRAVPVEANWQPARPTLARRLQLHRATGRDEMMLCHKHPQLLGCFKLSQAPQGGWWGRLWNWLWRRPWLAVLVSGLLLRLLHFIRPSKLRRTIGRLNAVLADYHYWLGVRDVVGTYPKWKATIESLSNQQKAYNTLTLELSTELPHLQAWLQPAPPDALEMLYRGQPLVRLEVQPGAEPLRPIHVREFLAQHLSLEMVACLVEDYPELNGFLPLPLRIEPISPVVEPPSSPEGPVFHSLPSLEEVAFKVYVTEYRLGQPFAVVEGLEGYEQAWVLVRQGRQPLGVVPVDLARVRPRLTGAAIERAIKLHSARLVSPAPPASVSPPPPISVIVCTRDRPVSLALCLASLARLNYPQFEVVVVDNAPGDEASRQVVEATTFRYVREDRPGIGRARNRGVAEACHDLLAFVDDDVQVDPDWLQGFAQAFARPGVAAVTGLIMPLELETPAQHWFEQYGGMSRGMTTRYYNRRKMTGLDLIATYNLGTSANLAVRREVYRAVGGFDLSFVTAEDLDLFHRLLAAGYTMCYEPSALVWHRHRRDFKALQRQLYFYGRGFGVYLLTLWRNYPDERASVLRYGLEHWILYSLFRRLKKSLTRSSRYPLRLAWAEFRGALAAPLAYRQARLQARTDPSLSTSTPAQPARPEQAATLKV